MKRLMIIVFCFFLSGLVFYNSGNVLVIGAVLTALFLIVYIKQYNALAVYCLFFMLIGAGSSYMHTMQFENKYNILSNSSKFEGYVVDMYEQNYTIRNYAKNYTVCISVYNLNEIKPGDYLYFAGKVKDRPDYRKNVMNSMGINAYVSCIENSINKVERNSLLLLPAKIKYKINNALLNMQKEAGGFICGLVSGYTGDISYEDKSNFNEIGISHVLAVSGFNLGIIYYFFTLITKKFSAKSRYIVTVFACFIYTSFAGFAPSILRAFIMICVAASAKIVKRPYDILNGITLTAFIMLIFNSFYIYNIGFLLSFLATYGIILFKDDINDRMSEKIKLLRDEISVSGAAIIATFPIVLWYRGVFSLLSLLINIIIGPIISLLTILSFAAGILFVITDFKFWFYPSLFIGEFFIKFIRAVSSISIPLYIGKPALTFIILYYLFILFYFGYIKLNIRAISKKYICWISIPIIVVSLIYHKPYLKIDVLNVGQGDSILIETPKRHTILVDTGPEYAGYTSLKEKVIPYLRRMGYDKLDMLLITHFHKDHAGGLDYIADGKLKVAKVAAYSKSQDFNVHITALSKGDSIKADGIEINIISPEAEEIPESTDDKNETCIIMELKYKDFSMLFTGDADKEAMECISGSFDVVKVPHHGSIYSLNEHMLDNSIIGNAVISVGKNNFGHPSPKVIDELEKRNIGVYRTDKQGDIVIITSGNDYRIITQ